MRGEDHLTKLRAKASRETTFHRLWQMAGTPGFVKASLFRIVCSGFWVFLPLGDCHGSVFLLGSLFHYGVVEGIGWQVRSVL